MSVFRRHGNWYIDYYYRGRRKREKIGCSKHIAIQALAVREAEIAQAKFSLISKRGGPTFGAVCDRYLEEVSVKKRGHRVEKYIIKTIKASFLGKLRVVNITSEDAEKYQSERAKCVKPATVNRGLTLAKHILTKAVEWRLIATNPFRGFRNLRVLARMERILTPEEEIRLLGVCERIRSSFLRSVILLALNTGMRRGELLSLEWTRVDFEQRTIHILNSKSASGDRVIPMNATVHMLLSGLAKKAASPLVFPSNRRPGERLLDLKKGFKKAVQLAGIRPIRFHDMRHTFATRLIRAGVDIVTVQKLLGHSKTTMTARYAHSLADAKIAAVSKLDSAGVGSSTDPNRTPTPFSVVPIKSLSSSAV